MAKRATRLKSEDDEGTIYTRASTELEFVSTGCTLLDCALGGGFCIGRIANIVGDRSSAKTAIATETVINFIKQYPDGAAFYRETEAAFDMEYARSMGLDISKVNFGDPDNPISTVEGFAKELADFIKQQITVNKPGIYVLDSLDALSDDAEMERNIGEGTFGLAKAKAMSILFRTIARKLERTKILLLIVSQVRDNINVSFGEKHRRSGGRSLDFYASQVAFLAHVKTLTKTIKKIERPYGVMIKAKIKKNKVSMPFRECEFPFIFGYGTEDLSASYKWLSDVGVLAEYGLDNININKLSNEDYKLIQIKSAEAVKKTWEEIEDNFSPVRSKY